MLMSPPMGCPGDRIGLSIQLRLRGIPGECFVLRPVEKRPITIRLVPGRDFTPDQVSSTDDRDIVVTLLSDDMALGGDDLPARPGPESATQAHRGRGLPRPRVTFSAA
jgi:hypothetical protein